MAEQEEYQYILAMGSPADWEAGKGSLYYIEDKNGENGMPVFTTGERAREFERANFESAEAHMQMFESLPVSHIPPLTEGRFMVFPLGTEDVARAALMADVDYLIRDPRPGDKQEILRLKRLV
jgi:hypothetical protein